VSGCWLLLNAACWLAHLHLCWLDRVRLACAPTVRRVLLLFVFPAPADNALKFPYLYNDGLTRKRLNIGILLWWLVSAIYESVILFVFGILGAVHPCKDGATPYVFELGEWVKALRLTSCRSTVLVHTRCSLSCD